MTSGGGPGEPRQVRDPGDSRVVPVYAFTQGRTRNAGRELPLEALATSTELAAQHGMTLQMEWRTIVQM